jgi:DNA-binding transcriptional MocR family regulator
VPNYRYEALEAWLREQIRSGRYAVGDKLPSVRALCESQGLSKATVLHALHRLEADQLIYAQPKSGYFVSTDTQVGFAPQKVVTPKAPSLVSVPDIFRDIMSRSAAFDILPTDQSASISSHLTTLNRLINKSARTHPELKSNYYDEPRGHYGLRLAIADQYRQRDTLLSADDLCITSGCQHALFLALMASCTAGDTVAVESPAFYGVLQLLEQLGLNVIEVSSDPITGIDIDELRSKSEQWPIKACVITPNYSTPTGAKIPLEQHVDLICLAEQSGFYLIEDDIYGELRFTGEPSVPLKAKDASGRVILCGSFSKSVSRDLRIGWVAGGDLHEKIIQLKLVTQLASPQATQEGIALFMQEGHFRRFVNQQCQRLREQRDALLKELKTHWQDRLRWTQPEGGLSCWVELPDAIDTQKSYKPLLDKGVILTPGALFSAQGLYKNHMRLSFSQPLTERRQAALHQLFKELLS